jgi:hypothetical protein
MEMATRKLTRSSEMVKEQLRERNPRIKKTPAIISSQGRTKAHRFTRWGGRMA